MIVYTVECAVGVYAWEGQFNSSRLFYMADVLQFLVPPFELRSSPLPETPQCLILVVSVSNSLAGIVESRSLFFSWSAKVFALS